MNFKGGYNVSLDGKPSDEINRPPFPKVIYLPLFSKRFTFTDLLVPDGAAVFEGQALAKDPANFSVPLLAPASGTVKIDRERRSITIDNPQSPAGGALKIEEALSEGAKKAGPEGRRRHALLRLGAWQYFSDAATGKLPDPFGTPHAVIVSVSHLEPFLPGTEALLKDRMPQFEKGLEHIHAVSGNKTVYLALPRGGAKAAIQIRDIVKRHSWIQPVDIPAKYPFDNVRVLARLLGFDKKQNNGPVWGCSTEGVLAVDLALRSSKPCVSRTISVGGPGAKKAEHVEVCTGYPLADLLKPYQSSVPARIINGGALSGDAIPADQMGLDAECLGLTLVPEQEKREILAFAHPGFSKHAFSNTFLGNLRPPFRERYTTGIRGEHRPCISCCFCEAACPSRLMPHLLHKYVEKNRLEEADRFGLNLCVQCGLCSHVCTSKIEIKQILLEGQQKFLQER